MPKGWRRLETSSNDEDFSNTEKESDSNDSDVSEATRCLSCASTSRVSLLDFDGDLLFSPKEVANFMQNSPQSEEPEAPSASVPAPKPEEPSSSQLVHASKLEDLKVNDMALRSGNRVVNLRNKEHGKYVVIHPPERLVVQENDVELVRQHTR